MYFIFFSLVRNNSEIFNSSHTGGVALHQTYKASRGFCATEQLLVMYTNGKDHKNDGGSSQPLQSLYVGLVMLKVLSYR